MRAAADPWDRLPRMRGRELDDLFRRSPEGPWPRGEGEGVMLLMPGTPLGRAAAGLLGLAWRGKVFGPGDGSSGGGTMVNRVLPLGIRAVPAEVRREASRLDGAPCYVLDYSRSSLVARGIRDEIREVHPGVYLGQVFWNGLHVGRFALRFGRRSAAGG